MGFLKEVYSGNRAGLIVAFGRDEASENYFDGDSVQEALKYFKMYVKDNEIYIESQSHQALETLGVKADEAVAYKETITNVLKTLDDKQAAQSAILFPAWAPNVTYVANDRIRFEGLLYRVLQDHVSQATWEPNVASSLFALILTDESGQPLEWVQPDSTNAYMTGDRVTHNEKIYESVVDNNVWEPGSDSTLWKVVENLGGQSISEWVAGTYATGDQVIYDGKTYESLIDNNVWSPADYPAGWKEIA